MVGNGERHTCWWQPDKRADDAAWVEPIDRDWNHHLSQARHTCGWKPWWLLLDGRVGEFSEDDLTLVLCNQWFVHCLILIFIRVSLGVFFLWKSQPSSNRGESGQGKNISGHFFSSAACSCTPALCRVSVVAHKLETSLDSCLPSTMLLKLANPSLVAPTAFVKGVCEGPEYKQVKQILLLMFFRL